ncbi:MAG: hypothetical protein II295_06615 [Akkermansia sp.]|nr:hypothetical protein [Akkermansia sp.]
MKKQEARKFVSAFALCGAMALCSCQASLIEAARQGNLETVRVRIAENPSSQEINDAAFAAYSMGHSTVLNELASAGAAVAPDNVLNKTIKAESVSFHDFGCEEYVDSSCFNAHQQTRFDSYWPTVSQWVSTNETQNMIWKDSNPCEIIAGQRNEKTKINRFYQRTAWNTAEIYVSQQLSPGTSYVDMRYALRFDTPSQGSFRCISQSRDWMNVSVGKFSLQDDPAEPEKKPEPAKKQGKKKKAKR